MPLVKPKKKRRVYADKNYKRLQRYGLTVDQYNAMRAAQNFACAICGLPETENARQALTVDHCHTTGKVRGLLCIPCNSCMGYAKDSIARLLKCVNYLAKHRKP